jgi:hypothetical protein
MPTKIEELNALLDGATSTLSNVSSKKMFGSHAAWVNENVFALIWKTGRIGIKLPNEPHYSKLMSESGAEPWKAGPKQMTHWVLMPIDFHNKKATLNKWVTKAHELCQSLPPKKSKPAAKTAPKKLSKPTAAAKTTKVAKQKPKASASAKKTRKA